MSSKLRFTSPIVLVTLLMGLMLHSCQAFEPPPEGVLTPQELIFTSAAETIIANLTPVLDPMDRFETPAASPPGLEAISPTPDEIPSPPQTPGPTPTLVLEFEDDFQEQGYWETANEEEIRAYYSSEGFRIENYATEKIVSNTVWLDYGDVRVEVSADLTAGPDGAQFGVVCRWQDDENFYAFLVAQTGDFAIARIQNGETNFLEEGRLEMELLPSAQYWRIAGGCLGHRLILEVEGQVLAETQDETFPVGLVGIAVGTRGEAGAEVSFESFKAFTPVLDLAPVPTLTAEPGPTASPTPPTTTQLPTPTPLGTALPSPTITSPIPSPTELPQLTSTPLVTVPAGTPTPPPATATPVLSLVFEDDFAIRRGWHTEIRPGFEMYYQANGYRIHNHNPSSNVSSIRTFDHLDIRVEVDATFVRWATGSYYGVVCRWQDLHNLYAFVLGVDGFHAIVKIQNREVIFLGEGQGNGSIELGGGVNRISGICQGNLLALEVNGQRLLETEDFTFGSGYVGLLVGNQDLPGSLVHFDNFTLFAP